MKRPAKTTALDPVAVLSKALLNASAILGLNRGLLGKVLGLSPASVSRLYSGQYRLTQDSKEWELATLLVRLYRGLDAMMASDETALLAWMQNPNRDLNGVPSERIATVTGLVDTVEYVDAFRARV
jgi:hypothetical protein